MPKRCLTQHRFSITLINKQVFQVCFTCDTSVDMIKKNEYNYEDLIKSGKGELFGKGNAQLPAPPMLMFDRIATINNEGGEFHKGLIVAELDITPDLWFFNCHFYDDPVMPGCLGLDAMWQLLGFYVGWTGAPGRGRALGAGQVKFSGQVLPTAGMVTYTINIKKLIIRKLVMGVADGAMAINGKEIYNAKDLRVGLFESTEGF